MKEFIPLVLPKVDGTSGEVQSEREGGGKRRGGRKVGGGGEGGRERGIRMIYSFRPQPLMKGCRWMTYHLTVHTIIIPMSKKTIKLTTMYSTRY